MDAMCLQLMIDQIMFGFQSFAAYRTGMPLRSINQYVHVAKMLPQIAGIRIDFSTLRTLWPRAIADRRLMCGFGSCECRYGGYGARRRWAMVQEFWWLRWGRLKVFAQHSEHCVWCCRSVCLSRPCNKTEAAKNLVWFLFFFFFIIFVSFWTAFQFNVEKFCFENKWRTPPISISMKKFYILFMWFYINGHIYSFHIGLLYLIENLIYINPSIHSCSFINDALKAGQSSIYGLDSQYTFRMVIN